MVSAGLIKSVQDTMRKDVGVDGDAQRLGQLVWMVFLKVFDDREYEHELLDRDYSSPLPERLRWRNWAADPEGLTGESLVHFINNDLFPALKDLPVSGPQGDRAAVVRHVFEDAFNYMKSGTLLRQVVNELNDSLDFNRSEDRQVFGRLYETLLAGLQTAGDAGEYYTPRAVTQFMVEMIDPRLGEEILDPACGTGGFLTSALEYVRSTYVRAATEEATLQDSIAGVEKKPLPHLLCTTNMVLHGIDIPSRIRRGNTLARPLRDYGPNDRVDVVLTNPPFRGTEEAGVENNFPTAVRTRITSDLFLSLCMHLLRPGGRCAIVLPDSSLFGEGVKYALRRRLVEDCHLHTIVRLPHGVFSPYTEIRTNILFFTKGEGTDNVWFYELTPPVGDKYTKTKPIGHEDFAALRQWWEAPEEGDNAWVVSRNEIEERDFNLDVSNPHRDDVNAALRRAKESRAAATTDLAKYVDHLDAELDLAPCPIGERAREFLATIGSLAGTVSMTSGFVDDLRLAISELALTGELSATAEGDEPVEQSLGQYPGAEPKAYAGRPTPPFTIPPHWGWVRLWEICDFRLGRTPPTKSSKYWTLPPEGTPWVSITDMPRRGVVQVTSKSVTSAGQDEVFKREPVPTGTLLMGFKLSVGKTSILGMDAYHNEAIASLDVADEALKHYLLWALPVMALHGGTNPAVRGNTLNRKTIAGLWIPVPPRQEQERVVAAIRWATGLVEEIAYRSEEARTASERVLKLIAGARALSSGQLSADLVDEIVE